MREGRWGDLRRGGGGGGRGNTYKLVRDYHFFVRLWEQFLS